MDLDRSGSEHWDSVYGSDAEGRASAVETESFLRGQATARRSRRRNSRSAFQLTRQEAVQEAVFQSRGIFLGMLFASAVVVAITTYFEIRSVYVLAMSYQSPCDQPLWKWLSIHVFLGVLRELSPSWMKPATLTAQVGWLGYGFYWLRMSKTCQATCPMLFNWVVIIVFVSAVFLTVSVLLPLLCQMLVAVLVLLLNRGMLPNNKSARPGTLDKLEVVAYDPSCFSTEIPEADDPRPQGECCCCTEEFDAEHQIVKTPCGHYYHKACLGDWLKLARTCPICRCDIDEVVNADAMLSPVHISSGP